MNEEIKQHVRADSVEEGAFSAEFCFPSTFSGFDGHFPENPVLPGICLIQAVLAATEMARDQKLKLTEIALAKFFSVSQPGETLTAVCRVDEEMVRAKISRGEDRVAEIRLKVTYA